VLVAAVAFAWWTISPLFVRTSLVEGQNITVPVATGPNDPESMEAAGGDSMSDQGEDSSEASMSDEQADMETDAGAEGMDESKAEGESMGSVTEDAAEMDGSTGDTMDTPAMEEGTEGMVPATPTAPAGPVVLAAGSFDRKDSVHYANGQAILARESDGSMIIRLQDLDAANGPDLYVYISEHPDPQNGDELHIGGHNLGSLKATNGSFSYTLDPGIDPTRIKSVVIYCRAFSVLFSTASLQPPQ
jgi:hypothetical protein